ncbi:MAG: IS5/IS1182 family transposase, partial [Marinosulfonomonas sp.]|nr:IS5/IS1182 family transposase [Marinosulfonomonas sp.]
GRFGYRNMRYRGRAKNPARMSSLLALANLYLARQQLRAKSVWK